MQILILNVHSALNLGDDAIMYETLQSLQRAFPQARITVAANDPASWRKYETIENVGSLTTWVIGLRDGRWYGRLFLVPVYIALLALAALAYRLAKWEVRFGSREQRRLLSAYYAADLVLSCGGGNFSAGRLISPFLILAFLTLAFALGLGKKAILLPQSIGPIRGRIQRLVAQMVLRRVALIMVRERRSLDFLVKRLKIQKRVMVLPDLAFGLPVAPTPRLPLPSDGEPSTKIGVTMMDRGAQTRGFAGQQTYEEILEAILVRLNQEWGAGVYIFSQCTGPSVDHDDRLPARRLYERLKKRTHLVFLLDEFRDALEIKAAYQGMDCVIGTRMHTGILALSTGVPAVLIGYQPKACGMMELFGLPEYCCDLEALTADRLYGLLNEILENREAIRQRITEYYARTRGSLQGWVRYLGL